MWNSAGAYFCGRSAKRVDRLCRVVASVIQHRPERELRDHVAGSGSDAARGKRTLDILVDPSAG